MTGGMLDCISRLLIHVSKGKYTLVLKLIPRARTWISRLSVHFNIVEIRSWGFSFGLQFFWTTCTRAWIIELWL